MECRKWLPAEPRERLTDLMKERGITQAQLAEAIGVNRSSLNRFLSGATDALSHDCVIRIARYFNVTTDFLLGETDDPGRINYDIGELGLTVQAAENLYTRKVDPTILCKLLEHERCGELMQRIGFYVDETLSGGIAMQNQLYSSLGGMLLEHAEAVPTDKSALDNALQTLQAMKQPVFAQEQQGIHTNLDAILLDMKKDGPGNAKKAAIATKSLMNQITTTMRKDANPLNLRKASPEMMVNNILAQLDMTDAPENLKSETERVIANLRKDLTDYLRILKITAERIR